MERLFIHLKKVTAGFVVQVHKCFGIISKAKENNNANEHTSENDSYEKTAHLSFVKHSKTNITLISKHNKANSACVLSVQGSPALESDPLFTSVFKHFR